MRIFKFLHQQEKACVSDIVNIIKLTQPTVSYHLKEMKTIGLLKSEKQGKEVYYSINHDCQTYNRKCPLSTVIPKEI